VPVSGNVIFMPWVTLPAGLRVGRFRFCPVDTKSLGSVVDSDIAQTLTHLLKGYVRRNGESIDSCTIVLRLRAAQAWNIPERMWTDVSRAAEILCLGCLAEQRFLEGHFSPHLNASMFHIIGQGVTAGSDRVAIFHRRRGGGLNVGGLRFNDVLFQEPPQIEGTECKLVGNRLLKALEKARRARHPVWEPISSSLELFLLGHAETPQLRWDSCVMLSAMAFERLLEPKKSSALAVSEAFARLWAPYSSLKLADARRIKPDHRREFVADQLAWPAHRKWMKELYEARSSRAHRGPRSDFSRNWEDWQHMVIAAFTYPFAVKLRLSAGGLYQLNERELGACEALDKLLDCHWGEGWKKAPEWSKILSMAESERELTAMVQRAIETSKSKTLRFAVGRRRRPDAGHRGYD
jgi:hypothetical protein